MKEKWTKLELLIMKNKPWAKFYKRKINWIITINNEK